MSVTQFLGSPKVQYFNPTTGVFLAGGLLYTYNITSTTPRATYPTIADAIAGTNANTNPVVLDSTGSAAVVLNGSTKLVLTDSLGNQVWAIDNVNTAGIDIIDSNGNNLLVFSAASAAVNALTISSGNSGSSPSIAATGGDTNINLVLNAKGTGHVKISNDTYPITDGTANQLLKTNGSGAIGFATVAYPAGDGTTGQYLITNGSAQLGWTSGAVKADQVAATSALLMVTPSTQIFHPASAKSCLTFDQASDTILSSYGISSVTPNSTGIFQCNLSTNFLAATYTVVGSADLHTGSNAIVLTIQAQSTSSYTLAHNEFSGTATSPNVSCSATFGTT